MDDFGGFHAGEFGVESLVLEGEAQVVDAEEMQKSGVEVMDMDRHRVDKVLVTIKAVDSSEASA